jgi:HEAT repeat protein
VFTRHAAALASVTRPLPQRSTMRNYLQIAYIISVALLLAPPGWAKRTAFPLNDYQRLGQVFSCQYSIASVAVSVPSWLDAEGGLTLTLWDSPERRTRIGTQAYVGIRDNEYIQLPLVKPLAPGTYYWEVDQRTGTTRIGLWADPLATDSAECAYFDGVPDHRKRFLFNFGSAVHPYVSVADALIALGEGRPLAEQTSALRQLAVQATPECIPRLAELLSHNVLGHLARSALEAMPGPTVDDVFRDSLGELRGALLVGVINSVGKRRDTDAVPALVSLLPAREAGVSSAATVALGMMGTASAAGALLQAFPELVGPTHSACCDAILTCARRLSVSGNSERARGLYDVLCKAETVPPGIREAAVRGAITARGGASGAALLLEHVTGDDPGAADAAFWVVHRGLPGREVTRALVDALSGLEPPERLRLVESLCRRADPVALPALVEQAKRDSADLRVAILRGLPYFGAKVTPIVAAAIGDADQRVSTTAERALGAVPGSGANDGIVALLQDAEEARRLAGIRLSGQRGLAEARPGLLRAANAADASERGAALKVLTNLAAPADVLPLLDVLARFGDEPTRGAAERALGAACRAAPEPQEHIPVILSHLPEADPRGKQALLGVVNSIGGGLAHQAVLKAAEDPEPAVRMIAFRLLGQWTQPETFPDLLRLAEECPDAAGKLLCLRACIRFVGQDTLDTDRRMGIYRQVTPMIQRADETKLLLAMLSSLPTAAALDCAAGHLADPAVRNEAANTVLAIAKVLVKGPDAEKAILALGKLKVVLPETDSAREAEALLRTVEPARTE